MITSPAESFEAGRVVGAGSFICRACGYRVVLEALDTLPECPSCAGARFERASLFDPAAMEPAEQPTLDTPVPEPPEAEAAWLATIREDIPEEGHYLAFEDEDEDEVRVIPLAEGWSRIGRSAAADIRLDDPTVSRRHALVVKTEEGRVRVLDDRSLNGVYVNGERVEWRRLGDGDEIAVGRYVLYLIDATRVRAAAATRG
jgi:hypothetical protein